MSTANHKQAFIDHEPRVEDDTAGNITTTDNVNLPQVKCDLDVIVIEDDDDIAAKGELKGDPDEGNKLSLSFSSKVATSRRKSSTSSSKKKRRSTSSKTVRTTRTPAKIIEDGIIGMKVRSPTNVRIN